MTIGTCGLVHECRPDRDLAREIDAARGELDVVQLVDHLHQVGGRVEDVLVRTVDVHPEHRAQRLVPRDDVVDGEAQCVDVERSGEPDPEGDVVRAVRRVALCEQPDAMLHRRQRDPVRPGSRDRAVGSPVGLPRLDTPGSQCAGQPSRGGIVEEVAYPDGVIEDGGQAAREAGGGERVAARVEERRRRAEDGHTEHVGEGRGDAAFEIVGGVGVVAGGDRGPVRSGQGASVEFAVGRGREPVESDHRTGDHERRQVSGHGRADGRGVGPATGGPGHIRHQHLVLARRAPGDDDGVPDAVDGRQRGLHLTRLDALPADLDLEVAAPEIDQSSVGFGADEVAGAVHAGAVAGRVGDEPVRGEVGSREIASRQLDPGEVQLSRDPRRHRA